MKKLITGILATLTCVTGAAGFASCFAEDGGLDKAKSYIDSLYKTAALETGADFERPGSVPIDGKTYNIVWSVNVSEGVVVVKNEDGTYTIDVDEAAEADVEYVLTGKISDGTNSVTVTYNHKVPKFKELTWAEFTATEDEKAVVIKGVITGIVNTSSKHELYLQDNDGGYYVYNLPVEEMEGLANGMEIRVRGTRDTYYDVNQVVDATVEVINSTPVTVEPLDITDIYTAADTLGTDELIAKQSMLVTLKGVTVLGQNASDQTYFDFILGEKKSYVRISSSACIFSEADQTAFKNTVADKIGFTADVVGLVSFYNGKFYVIPESKDAFTNFTIGTRAPADQIALENILLDYPTEVLENGEIALQTEGKLYKDVKIAWSSADESIAKVEGGKLIVTLPTDEAKTVKLTATLTCGDATPVVEEIEVDFAKFVALYPETITEAPVVGTEYKLYLDHTNLKKDLYFAGEMDGYYLGTTTSVEKATSVYVEEAASSTADKKAYNLYFMDGQLKTYIHIYTRITDQEKNAIGISIGITADIDAVKNPFYWDADMQTLMTAEIATTSSDATKNYNNKYFIGTASDKAYTTFSASYNTKACVARLATLTDEAPETPEEPEKPAMTPVEIVEAAYALEVGAALEGAQTLTGIITKVDTAYSADYKNVTVTIAVNGIASKTIQCFRLKGDGADSIAVGDVITVTGVLKNYNGTIEFDAGCTLDSYATAKATVEAAYALAGGASMEGTQTLTGVITKVDTAYSAQYKNVTVTIQVGDMADKLIQCYRLKGLGAAILQVGDTVTVSGIIKNYVKDDKSTIEFDSGCVLESFEAAELTEAEIVTLAYSLEANATLPGTYTLTGVIKTIDQEYNTQYKNITVTIQVGDMADNLIQCYRLKGDGAENLKVGDTITVTGVLMNYVKDDKSTIEFTAGCVLKADIAVANPVAETEYYLYAANSDGQVLYFSGMGTTLTTTTDATKAIKVKLEATATEGVFYLYYMDGTTKKYINMTGDSTKKFSAVTSAAQATTWNVDTATKQIINSTYSTRAIALYESSSDLRTYAISQSYIWVWFAKV